MKKFLVNLLLTMAVFIVVFWIAALVFNELGFWHIFVAAFIASGILTTIRKYIDRK
ncbi:MULTISPECIES: hypothetical protein [Streptococcus]|uniref:Uncharacterized protein n=1 Tax=Streptococcus caledonicus TaxID=2614158 RepID=A0ABW0UFT3_9STRE|nr:hypothetical protein [Streptococcus sp. S784/96/1]